jgi:methyltransferase (TIGR00027 family)
MTEFEDQGLPLTALAVAAGRAVETTRPDALAADPFATGLVEAARSHVDFPTVWPAHPDTAPPLQQPLLLASIYIGLRTRFIDDFLEQRQQTAQAVILGAGLDTRAYRLSWPAGARVYELDLANVLDFKAAVMAGFAARPACELVSVTADLSQPWEQPLLAAGFDPQQPTTWVIEGLLPYLSANAQLATLQAVLALSPSGSRAVIERAVPLPAGEDVEAKLRDFSAQTGLSMGELLARANPPDPARLLEAAGWERTEHPIRELCVRYGRTISLTATDGSAQGRPLKRESQETGQSRGGFVTAGLPAHT